MGDDRSNIVFIHTDQQRFDTIGALGFDYMDTPNLDRLVEEGVAFTRSFVSAPSCAPSRASIFTGYFPHTTGVLENMDRWTHSWVEQLADSGYHCVNVGKMHTMPWETPMGFHERYVVENKDRYRGDRWYVDEWDKALRARGLTKPSRATYAEWPDWQERLGAYEWPLPEDMHPDNFVGDLAIWWLDYQPKTAPLFMSLGFPGPHPPYDPVESYAAPYLEKDLPIQDFTEAEIAAQPATYRATREKMLGYNPDAVCHLENPDREQRHRQRAYYLANVTMIDEKIGELIEALERNDYLDNTVIVFISDHGDNLGDHGHSQKFTFYGGADALHRLGAGAHRRRAATGRPGADDGRGADDPGIGRAGAGQFAGGAVASAAAGWRSRRRRPRVRLQRARPRFLCDQHRLRDDDPRPVLEAGPFPGS